MKAIVDAQLLGKELKKMSPVIKKNSVLPILFCVKMSFEKSKLTLRATDLETTIITTIPCECKTPFEALMEFKDINDLCNRFAEPITIEKTATALKITTDTSKFSFASSNDDIDTFPIIPEETFLFDIEADLEFFYSLASANNCRVVDDLKVTMNAPCIHIQKDKITIVGTDANILFKNDLKIKTGNVAQIMVSPAFIPLIKGIEDAKISIGKSFMRVAAKDLTIITRLLDQKFCNYEMILPANVEYNLKINREELVSSLSKAGISANAITHFCVINFNGGDIKLTTQDMDYGKSGETKVKAEHSVQIEAIGVNANQMLQVLNLFDSKEVQMAFETPSRTIYLRPAEDPNTLCLLQPISL